MKNRNPHRIVSVICQECGKSFGARNTNKKRCPECDVKVNHQRQLEYQRRKNAK